MKHKKKPEWEYENNDEVDKLVPSQRCIRIKSGKFKDYLYFYDTVKFIENEDGTLTLSYTYNIVEPQMRMKGTPEFENVTGDILTYILRYEN